MSTRQLWGLQLVNTILASVFTKGHVFFSHCNTLFHSKAHIFLLGMGGGVEAKRVSSFLGIKILNLSVITEVVHFNFSLLPVPL